MQLSEFQQVQPGDVLWHVTGLFTATRVKVTEVIHRGATSTVWAQVLDSAPVQPSTETLNGGRGLSLSYRKLEFLGEGQR